jgi:hypothetical protein
MTWSEQQAFEAYLRAAEALDLGPFEALTGDGSSTRH